MKSSDQIDKFRPAGTDATQNPTTVSGGHNFSCEGCALKNKCSIRNITSNKTQQFENLITGRRRIVRNSSAFRKNERLDKLYVVRSGQFKLSAEDCAGSQRVLGFYLPGDVIGLNAIAVDGHNYQFIALENSEVCEMSLANITNLMGQEPEKQMLFLRIMSESLNSAFTHSFLAAMPLEQRFAAFLLWIGGKHARLGYSDQSFRLAMSRSDIGSYIHTTLASVSRLVNKFNAKGVVAIQGRMVELRDRNYLVGLACRDEEFLPRVV